MKYDYYYLCVDSNIPLEFMYTRKQSTRVVQRTGLTSSSITFIKNLRKIKKREGGGLHRVLIVDDNPDTYVKNYGNAIRITPWNSCERDDKNF